MTTIGGYRVIRRLGAGERATVFLAHPEEGEGVPVALKVAVPGDAERAYRELDALDRAYGPNVVRLLDAATGVDGMPIAVLERHPGSTLADALARRATLEPGEAVGALVPLALALERLHSAGISHGGLRADAILLSADGRPVLAGFGLARARQGRPSPAARDADPELAADCAALQVLAVAVLTAAGAVDAAAWVRSAAADATLPVRLAARLQGLADPLPIVGSPLESPAAVPSYAPPSLDDRSLVPRRGRRRAPAPSLRERASDALRRAWSAARAAAGGVRPRFWALGACGLLALVAALVLVPGRPTDATTAGGPASAPTPSATVTRPARQDALAPATGESPEVALERLLGERAACLRSRSVVCLGSVDQAGSSAAAEDAALVRSLRDGADAGDPHAGLAPEGATVVDEYGGAALIAVSDANGEPAPVLLMRTEAGWRIRSFLRG